MVEDAVLERAAVDVPVEVVDAKAVTHEAVGVKKAPW